jgi:hypothetical protein
MTRIHTDHNGVYANAISSLADGTNVEGHQYHIVAGKERVDLNFQFGGVANNGVNGITNEALLAILIHRMHFLNRQFWSRENERVITSLEDALAFLEVRTARRISRGTEGKDVL